MLDFAVTLGAAQAGDESAFAELYRAFNPMLVRFLRVLAGPDCDDLAADTWVDVVRSLRRFSGDEAGFRGWLFTIARRRHLDWRRRLRRRPATVADEGYEGRLAPAPDHADEVVAALSTSGALDLIATLAPDQAEVVALRVVVGLDVAEVAAITGKSPGAVRVLAHRGLHRLAKLLGAQVPEADETGV